MRRHTHEFDDRDGICEGCGIHRDEFMDVVKDEVRDLEAESHRLFIALRNVLGLASRMKRKGLAVKEADHLLRFCADVGVVPQILRSPTPTDPKARG